jgi:hypothetical protein
MIGFGCLKSWDLRQNLVTSSLGVDQFLKFERKAVNLGAGSGCCLLLIFSVVIVITILTILRSLNFLQELFKNNLSVSLRKNDLFGLGISI